MVKSFMAAKKKILIVEDEPDLSNILRVRFSAEGLKCCREDDLQACAGKVNETGYRNLDLMLPRFRGGGL